MRAQVVVTTYEQPRALGLVLAALERQTVRDFGLIVADDGSGPATRERIERHARATGREIIHVWQPNRGFRKCRSLNRAIAAATAELLVFLDGDALPRRDFLAEHLRLARPGRYLAGRLVRLGREVSDAMSEDDVASGRFEGRRFLWRAARRGQILQKAHYAFVPAWLGRAALRRDGGSWTGANGSAFRSDVLAVNGFDERMGYGWEDTDFGQRLGLAGVARISVRYSALAFHLDHDRPWRDEAAMARHRALMEESLRAGLSRCYHGVDRLAETAEPEARIDRWP